MPRHGELLKNEGGVMETLKFWAFKQRTTKEKVFSAAYRGTRVFEYAKVERLPNNASPLFGLLIGFCRLKIR
jgi:hypothetical protein